MVSFFWIGLGLGELNGIGQGFFLTESGYKAVSGGMAIYIIIVVKFDIGLYHNYKFTLAVLHLILFGFNPIERTRFSVT